MIINHRILTARKFSDKEWLDNTTNVYEYQSITAFNKFPKYLKKHFDILSSYLNKYDIIIGIKLFISRNKFDIIISNSGKQALTYCLLTLLFRKKKCLHILNEIYLHEPIKFRNKIRPYLYRLILQHVDFIRVSSKNEINNYSRILHIDKNKFWFLPWPSPVLSPKIVDSDEDYILSAGKQYRDYSTLIKAIRGTGYKLIIVSDKNSMKDVDICDEVTVYYNISKEAYLDLLLKSRLVVVPLNMDYCSCGQIALLEAMSFGKPVIVTKVVGSIDYIEDGKTGLFYERGNFKDLRNKIIILSENKELRNTLALEALYAIENIYNNSVFINKFFHFINEKRPKIADL